MTTFYIVTPSFNQAAFIKTTIESVLSQTGDFKMKYFVIDGNSSDDTLLILKQYRTRLKYVSESDNGQSDALNKGIRAVLKAQSTQKVGSDADAGSGSSTDTALFAYINSDDYYLPEAFAQVAAAFRAEPEKQWLVGDALIVNERGQTVQSLIRAYKSFWRWLYKQPVLSVLNPIPQPATFIRLDAVAEVGEFNEELQYVMDYEYWHRLQAAYGNPILLHSPLAAFRIHAQSKGGQAYHEQFAEELSVARKFAPAPVWGDLHSLHNLLITAVYRLIK